VTILVFTLDGDVVKALHRGRLGAGTYTFTWNGTNAGGNPVARGMYFIRVVGPGIDEIRKVMVIKN
jgi:flagellar hook assembly protein FlgD